MSTAAVSAPGISKSNSAGSAPATSDQASGVASAALDMTKRFMKESMVKYANCPALGGGSQIAYVAGGMTFELPVILGGFAKALVIAANVNLAFGAVAAGTYQLNAAAPFNLFTNVLLQLNNAQVQTHPYLTKVINLLRGYSHANWGKVLSGNAVTTISNALFGSIPITANTTNNWLFQFRLPLNAVSDDSPWGLIPLSGVGAQAQVTLTGQSALYGVDPWNSCVSQTSGSDGAVTIASNSIVQLFCEYLDGTSGYTTDTLPFDVFSQPTLQWVVDNTLNNVVSGSYQRSRIATLQENYYLITILIDGNQSTKFAAVSNISVLQLAQDQQGQNSFWKYGAETNVPVTEWFGLLRWIFGQDVDEGVIPWVYAPGAGINDPDNRSGTQVLNMTDSGWPAATVAAQITSAGSVAGINPRMMQFVVCKNTQGLLKK